jgi:hypothetical protein
MCEFSLMKVIAHLEFQLLGQMYALGGGMYVHCVHIADGGVV